MFNFLKNLFKSPPPRPENTGVLMGQRASDYVAGTTSPIPYQLRVVNGNWQPYAWSKNKQWCWYNGQYVDQMSCVTHSMLTAIETQEFFLTGKQVKYSRRWIAKLSGTTKQGNYQYLVADAIRNYGLVKEETYPTPDSYTWEQFYQDIPRGSLMYSEGSNWLKKWNFQYEFLSPTDPNLDYHLKHCPIQIVIPGHAVCEIYSKDSINELFRDSYEPWDKTTPIGNVQSALKPILTLKSIQARQVGWNNSPELGIYLPADSMDRFKMIKDNLPDWIPGYSLDDSQVYKIPANKPNFNL